MRLINTQARNTRKSLTAALNVVNKAIEQERVKGVKAQLDAVLSKLPQDAQKIVKELAKYEAEFAAKKLQKYNKNKKIKTLSETELKERTSNIKAVVQIGQKAQKLDDIYTSFASIKSKQLTQLIADSRVLKEEKAITLSKAKNLIEGLFRHQNKSLAALSIIATANDIRGAIAEKNNMGVVWTADFENSNVCSYCEDMDGEVFDEPTDDIPAHANCMCFWTVNEE